MRTDVVSTLCNVKSPTSDFVSSFTFTEDAGNKCFRVFVQGRIVQGKKSFSELICKARLKTGTEKKKKILKSLSVIKEDCRAFGLLGNKAEKLAEALKYPMYL